MKKLLMILTLISLNAVAERNDRGENILIPTAKNFSKKACVGYTAHGIFNFFLVSKIDKNHYLLSQQIGQGMVSTGIMETLPGTTYEGRGGLNIGLQYVTTEKIKGDDGFEHSVDFWRECK